MSPASIGGFVEAEERSSALFGRHHAIRVFAAIARLPKPDFTSGEVQMLCGAPNPAISKELKKLVRAGLLVQTSRRGNYERVDEARVFWEAMEHLGEAWGLSQS